MFEYSSYVVIKNLTSRNSTTAHCIWGWNSDCILFPRRRRGKRGKEEKDEGGRKRGEVGEMSLSKYFILRKKDMTITNCVAYNCWTAGIDGTGSFWTVTNNEVYNSVMQNLYVYISSLPSLSLPALLLSISMMSWKLLDCYKL
jgi:hypothetical protein